MQLNSFSTASERSLDSSRQDVKDEYEPFFDWMCCGPPPSKAQHTEFNFDDETACSSQGYSSLDSTVTSTDWLDQYSTKTESEASSKEYFHTPKMKPLRFKINSRNLKAIKSVRFDEKQLIDRETKKKDIFVVHEKSKPHSVVGKKREGVQWSNKDIIHQIHNHSLYTASESTDSDDLDRSDCCISRESRSPYNTSDSAYKTSSPPVSSAVRKVSVNQANTGPVLETSAKVRAKAGILRKSNFFGANRHTSELPVQPSGELSEQPPALVESGNFSFPLESFRNNLESQDDKTGSEKAQDDKTGSEKAQDDKTGSEKAQDDKAAMEKAQDDKAGSEKAQDEKAGSGTAQDVKDGSEKALDDKDGSEKAQDDKDEGETSDCVVVSDPDISLIEKSGSHKDVGGSAGAPTEIKSSLSEIAAKYKQSFDSSDRAFLLTALFLKDNFYKAFGSKSPTEPARNELRGFIFSIPITNGISQESPNRFNMEDVFADRLPKNQDNIEEQPKFSAGVKIEKPKKKDVSMPTPCVDFRTRVQPKQKVKAMFRKLRALQEDKQEQRTETNHRIKVPDLRKSRPLQRTTKFTKRVLWNKGAKHKM